jgi:hypothetical protein
VLPRAPILEVAIALLAGFAVRMALSPPFELSPGERAFRRLVSGATPSGRVLERAVVSAPSVRRSDRTEVRLEVEGGVFRLGVDNGPAVEVRPSRDGVVLTELPATGSRGARLHIVPLGREPPLVLRRIAIVGSGPALWPSALALLATFATAIGIGRLRERRLGIACGLAMSGFAVLSADLHPAAAVLLAASAAVGFRSRFYWAASSLLAALVFGAWVRFYFLPSAGSWDTEYWKASMSRAVDAGVPRVYGDADATPEGHFVSHLLGREDLFQIEYKGRDFVVDYPPLAIALWRWSWQAVGLLAPDLDRGEAENVSVKLPAVLGDFLSLLLLIYVFRAQPLRGLTLGALYWALPVSWLPSAVLGFLDGAYAPFAVLGLVAAARGRAAFAGALVAVAALIKPQALILAPAALVALESGRARAVASGLAVVTAALVPFALAGTLQEAVTHVFRILFQQRLSAGFANLWWVVGHAASGAGLAEKVEYARIDSLPVPAGLVGTALFLLAAGYVLYVLSGLSGASRAACLAGAALVLAYGTLAMGVHENHPHSMFLAFAATGLFSRRLRVLVSILSVSYLLNMLSLSGLGRFYGLRYMALEPLAAPASALRMGLGFDLTLLLGVLNTGLFVWLLTLLRSEFASEAAFLYSSSRKCG